MDKGTMFAVLRTGGKQYRVAAGDKIAVEKLAGDAGDTITVGEVLLAGDGGEILDASKVKVSAEIIAQAKSEKVIVFKKRRRHNYRRKAGHRQQLTLLRILSVGDSKAPAKQAVAKAKADEPAKGIAPAAGEKAKEASPVKTGATKKATTTKPAVKKAPAKTATKSAGAKTASDQK